MSRLQKLVIESDDLIIGDRLFQISMAAALKTWDVVIVLILSMMRRLVPTKHSIQVRM